MKNTEERPPIADIPARERWLWKNKEAIKSVQEGIADLDADRAHKMDKEIQTDVEDAIDRIERGFKQAEAGEAKEVPNRFLEFDEE